MTQNKRRGKNEIKRVDERLFKAQMGAWLDSHAKRISMAYT